MNVNRFDADIHLKKKKWSRAHSRHSDIGVRSVGDLHLHNPFSFVTGQKLRAVLGELKWAALTCGRHEKSLPLANPYSRARTRPIHIDFALVVVYRRWPPHSPGESARKKEKVCRRKRESTEDLINGEWFPKRLYLKIYEKEELNRRRKN